MSKIEILDSTNPKEIISVNGYTIKERIGVGSYGRVYKVFKQNIYYVLKEIPLNLSNATEKINSVQNEAEILSSLNNKYVVKFYESFKMNQNIYILMEYCDNGDLCTFLSKIKKARKSDNYYLDEDFVWKLFIQMSIGLYYIHSKKIIHRDIKTLNIFLTKDLDAKIGDLGVAKILEHTNHANTFIGTPYYVSPEMCKNKPYNEKSDIWALGCILYELLTFNHPFTANSQPALFIKILNSSFNPFPPGVPEDLKHMVEFILQKDCAERPSMEEILTSYSFQYNAVRIGLEKDLKDVLKVVNLPIYSINKILNKVENFNNQRTFINQISNTKNSECNNNFKKNQKSSLIISKSVNPLSPNLNKKSISKIHSNHNIFKNKKSFYKYINKNDFSSNLYIRLVKNNSGFQEKEESINKRTKSDFNYYIDTNNNEGIKKENKVKKIKKSENKNIKKYSVLDSILLNQNQCNINPRKTRYLIKSRKKLKDFSEKNMNNNINKNKNNISTRLNISSKINGKIKNNINVYENKIIKGSKTKQNINEKSINHLNIKDKYINKDNKKVNIKKEEKNRENINKINSDIISEEEFIKELNNAIRINPVIVNLNELLNHNFFSDESKNLNTTSATTLLGKIENPSNTLEQKYEIKNNINKGKKSSLNDIEDEKLLFGGSCDEFTDTEIINKFEPYLINPIPLSHYEIKINKNKKGIKKKNIIEMSNDELMNSRLIYKNKYEKYLEEFKQYSSIIDINEVKKLYANIENINKKDIKKIFDSITNYVKKKLPKRKIDDIVDILYNLISYEIKYKMVNKAVNNN